MRAYSARVMVWSECSSGRSVAMYVDSFEPETTRVATLTLPHSVMRAFGIASAYRRISSGDGFQMAFCGSIGSDLLLFALRAGLGAAATSFVERSSVMKESSTGFRGGGT